MASKSSFLRRLICYFFWRLVLHVWGVEVICLKLQKTTDQTIDWFCHTILSSQKGKEMIQNWWHWWFIIFDSLGFCPWKKDSRGGSTRLPRMATSKDGWIQQWLEISIETSTGFWCAVSRGLKTLWKWQFGCSPFVSQVLRWFLGEALQTNYLFYTFWYLSR